MIDDVYNSKLLEFAGNIKCLERLDNPDATARAHSKLCGSTITVDINVGDDGRITDFGQEVKACALGQSAASIVARHVIGTDRAEMAKVREEMRAMLKENGEPPTGRFEDLKYLQPVRDYKARHASTMLVFDAIVDALDQVAAKRAA